MMYHTTELLMRLRSLLFAVLLFSLPLIASAEQQTMLDLSDRNEQAAWITKHIASAETLATGVRIRTTQTGFLTREMQIRHGIDVVEILYTSPAGAQPSLIWRKQGGSPDHFYQIPLQLLPTATPAPITIALSTVGNWTTHPITLGLSLPPGTDITIHGIKLRGWTVGEKTVTALRCFWTFDVFKAHSINFFWGPLLCTTPVTLENLYRNQPPVAHSGMRLIYGILVLGACVFFLSAWLKRLPGWRSAALRRTLVLTLVLWAVLDLRMGAELWRNWTFDLTAYVRKPIGQRVFRHLKFFPDFATATRGLVTDEPRFVLLTPTQNTFRNYMRYQTWPSEPVSPQEGSGAVIWLVYERPDVTVDTEGQIRENGQVISPSGTVIHEFMEGTFAFRVNPSPSPSARPDDSGHSGGYPLSPQQVERR